MNLKLKNFKETVIDGDYCSGCGICASVDGSPFKMGFNSDGMYRPKLVGNFTDEHEFITSICPFSNDSSNETELGQQQFETHGAKFNEYTGYYLKHFAGHVTENDFRLNGSSGGMGNWLAYKLLEEGYVDGIIHVKESNKEDLLFEYSISRNGEELSQGAKSKYYPIELSQVINVVRENEGNYALIGIPCFIKSVRLLANKDETIKNRIKYFIGLVCGHLKSDMFAKSIAWQLGIEPNNLKNINFRKKLPNRGANDYGVEVTGEVDGKKTSITSPTKELYTTNWGQGFFKYNACEFCDDVLAETADVTVGDAWLAKYQSDYLGTNIVTVRNPIILNLIEENINKGNLSLQVVDANTVYETQAGGFRHRREGVSYRLYLKDQKNEWRPQKRVKAHNNIKRKRKKIYEQRSVLLIESINAYNIANRKNDFNEFKSYMDPFITIYKKTIAPSKLKLIARKLKKIL